MEPTQQFTEEYKKYGQQYDLPELDTLDNEFEILDAIAHQRYSPHYPLRMIRRRMVDIFVSWVNYLHDFIMPNPQSAILIRESEGFSEEEKKKITDVIKEIMYISRLSAKMNIEQNEKEDAEFITKYFKEWQTIKAALGQFATINIESWKKDMPGSQESYFG